MLKVFKLLALNLIWISRILKNNIFPFFVKFFGWVCTPTPLTPPPSHTHTLKKICYVTQNVGNLENIVCFPWIEMTHFHWWKTWYVTAGFISMSVWWELLFGNMADSSPTDLKILKYLIETEFRKFFKELEQLPFIDLS